MLYAAPEENWFQFQHETEEAEEQPHPWAVLLIRDPKLVSTALLFMLVRAASWRIFDVIPFPCALKVKI
jgi:hypothetical protein